jgi:hypothetical protein
MKILAAHATVVALAAGSAMPPGPPPRVGGTMTAPPPAWVEFGRSSRWLAYGSYCWETACVDMIPPDRRADLPLLRARRGQLLRIQLRFAPRSVVVRVGSAVVKRDTARTTSWHARRSGLIFVDAKGRGGSASYLARLTVRP